MAPTDHVISKDSGPRFEGMSTCTVKSMTKGLEGRTKQVVTCLDCFEHSWNISRLQGSRRFITTCYPTRLNARANLPGRKPSRKQETSKDIVEVEVVKTRLSPFIGREKIRISYNYKLNQENANNTGSHLGAHKCSVQFYIFLRIFYKCRGYAKIHSHEIELAYIEVKSNKCYDVALSMTMK